MRTTRAYLASFGTSGVLLIGAALLLAGMSTLVAFTAWPDGGIRGPIERVFGGERTGPELSGPERLADAAADAARAVAGRAAPGTLVARSEARESLLGDLARVGDERAASVPAGTPVAETPGAPDSRSPGDTGGDGGSPGTADPPNPAPQNDILPIGGRPGGGPASVPAAARGITAGLGETVSTLSPALGGGVTDLGDAVADLVESLPDVELLDIRVLGGGR